MFKGGDRVKLTARAAAAFNNNKRPSMFDWTARRGVVERITTNKANAVVLWDGRMSREYVPIRAIRRNVSARCDSKKRPASCGLIGLLTGS